MPQSAVDAADPDPVPGVLLDGVVRCPCGKRVGDVTDRGCEFWCPRCRRPVEIDFARMKADGLLRAIAGINAAIAANVAYAATLEKLACRLGDLDA